MKEGDDPGDTLLVDVWSIDEVEAVSLRKFLLLWLSWCIGTLIC